MVASLCLVRPPPSRSEQALQRLTTAAAPAAVAAPARPPSLPSIPLSLPNITTLLPIPSNDPSYPLRAHFLSCHSHPSPPSYPRTLTPQAMPVVLRTDPELPALCHCVLIHLAGCGANRATAKAPQRQRDEVMLHRRPASPCCACLPAPAAHFGLGSLWAASAVSGQFAAITAWCSVSTGVTDRPTAEPGR